MGWTITLEDERGNVEASASKEFRIGAGVNFSEFRLLHYLDPYADAVFNRLQVDDLVKDLFKLKKTLHDPLLEEIIALAKQCKEQPHTYLVFYGD